MISRNINEKVQQISQAIHSVLANDEIMRLLSRYGYGRERITEGCDKADRVNKMIAEQIKEYGDQYSVSETIAQTFDAAYARYVVSIKLSRIAFKGDSGTLFSLRASGERNRAYSGWLRDAHLFYGYLMQNNDALQRIAMYGKTEERVREEWKQVEELERIYLNFLMEMGDDQQSVKDLDQAIDELTNWYSDFRAIARIALYERPELLESLGIVLKS